MSSPLRLIGTCCCAVLYLLPFLSVLLAAEWTARALRLGGEGC